MNERQWRRLILHLPPPKPARGIPAKDHRTVIEAIQWVAHTGAPWRDLPSDAGFCWKTAAARLYRCTASVVWAKILAELQLEVAGHGRVYRSKHFVDGTVVRAHQRAAGAKVGSRENKALGRSRGGFTTKFHVRAEGNGMPLAFVLTPGQRHEARVFEPLMEMGESLGRADPNRSPSPPEHVVGDKGYGYQRIRRYLARREIRAVIPRRSNQGEDPHFDRELYRERNKVKRLVGRLKQWRRVATRYEKRAGNYLAMLMLAATVPWPQFADTS